MKNFKYLKIVVCNYIQKYFNFIAIYDENVVDWEERLANDIEMCYDDNVIRRISILGY